VLRMKSPAKRSRIPASRSQGRLHVSVRRNNRTRGEMLPMRKVMVLSSAILLGMTHVGLASASKPAPPIELAGITRITGTKPGYVSVNVPKTVRLRNPLLGGKDVHVEGRGDFVGFALVPERPSAQDHTLLGGRLPESAGRRMFLFDVGSFFADSIIRKWIHVHKGEYRLYLLPGKAYAEVELRIDGLQGGLEVQATHEVQYKAGITKTKYSSPGHNYYSAGGTSSLGGRGLVFGTVWMNTALHGVTNADVCFWRNQPQDPAGYGPNCGGAFVIEPGNLWDSNGTIDHGAGTHRPFRMYYGSWQPFESGFGKPGLKYGQSVVVQSASAIESIGSLGVWLTYD